MTTRNPKSKIQNPKSRQRTRKRGIVLLIVVSLLAIFILMGVAFAIVAMHYRHTAEINTHIERYGDPPARESELILDQILFDTLARSSLRFHSLLGDLYGGDSVGGVVSSVPSALDTGPYTAGQYPPQQPQVWQFYATPTTSFHQSPGYYAGRVMTFLPPSPAAGHSTRILEYAYDPNSGLYAFAVEAIESKGPLNLDPANGSPFLINGAPFNGVGAGYDNTTRQMFNTYQGRDYTQPPGNYLPTQNLVALMPHFSGYDATGGTFPMGDPINAGGLDESWDAVDFQNMFLAMVPPTAAGGGVPVIPSFHRQELVHYWRNHIPTELGSPLDAVDLDNNDPNAVHVRNWLRTFIFRPMPWDHPNFNGSNPTFDLANARQQALVITGGSTAEPALSQEITKILINNLAIDGVQWDIDNDNDGVPESIWVDPGLPVVTRPDGRRYKRLVAICIKDLDGRINLNAHGNGAQVATDANGFYSYRAEYQIPAGPPPANFGMLASPNYVPRGVGFGPADVDFLNVLTTTLPAYTDAGALAAYTRLLQGRYASNSAAGDTGTTAAPGIPSTRETLSFVKHHGIPNTYAGQFSWYASPPDVWGRGAIVLDVGGQPRTTGMGMTGEVTDYPYELSLSGEENDTDSPYTLVELERMLRYHDQDVQSIVSRPLQLATDGAGTYYLASSSPGVIGPDEALRNLFTTHSSHIPTPASTLPREMRAGLSGTTGAGSATILDVYRAKLAVYLSDPQLTYELRKIVPWEFAHGQKFDINRWLGDGFDSNGDGTPDDPFEATTENAWQAPASFAGVGAQPTNSNDLNGDGAVNGADNFSARQLYARHLYCLAAMLVPSTFDPPSPQEPGLSQPQRQQLAIRRIAQWAINCAEFRDPDSIMTPFEYDINPGNGWQVDGNPATDGTAGYEERIYDATTGNYANIQTSERRLVWGMEYPDLLISESLAFHDRRVKDTNQASNGMTPDYKRTDTPMPDDDLDQFRVPQGSLFLELYCPHNTYNRNPLVPRELYDVTVPNNPRLNLAKLAPARPTDIARPVWRMAISRITKGFVAETLHPRQPSQMATNNRESASYDPAEVNLTAGQLGANPVGPLPIERFVWFTNAATAGVPAPEINNIFYNTAGAPLVEPGQYAVIGPRVTTYLGSQDPANANPPAPATFWGGNSPQRIDLNAGGITITDTNGVATSRTPGTDIRPAVPVVVHYPCAAGTTPVSAGAPWGTANWDIGLNVTEPLPAQNAYAPTANYYPEPTAMISTPGADRSFYDDPTTPLNDGTGFKDQPVEAPVAGNGGRPIVDHQMTRSGTYLDCASVFLQRLANPNLPYNPLPNTDPYVAFDANFPVNPYISVDWQTLDASVFSGEEHNGTIPGGGDLDPDDPNDGSRPTGGRPQGSRQRGYRDPMTGAVDSNYWNPDASAGDNFPNSAAPGPYFHYDLSAPATPPMVTPTGQTLGYVNAPVGTPMTAPYLGEPSLTTAATPQTCPWLTWNNRPFSNAMELLMVPSSSPGRICSEITPGPLNNFMNVTGNVYDAPLGDTFRAPFGPLLNLFHTSNPDPGTTPPSQMGAQLARVLDYLEVPSPYLGAERWYNPSYFGAPLAPLGSLSTYRPPFNKVSRFRDAGLININTIFDSRIWISAVAQAPLQERAATGYVWNSNDFFNNKVVGSRQGYAGGPYTMNPNFGTRFTNPFRAADASDMMADPNGAGGPDDMRKNRPVDATFLRPDPITTAEPLFAVRSTAGHDNTERNPYFRYQGFQKMGNVFSTTSNVFAVWMTVGYFEVEDNLDFSTTPPTKIVDAAHPEGIKLGQEIGADSGEVVRHRSFYIIDRSVPVGFQPGQKLNTDNCILLRRQIE